MNYLRALAILVPLGVAAAVSADPTVDITLVDGGAGSLEVRFRPDGTFNGLFSSLVFTVRWSDASGATLGDPAQTPPVIQYMSVSPAGSQVIEGGYRYQIYAGFGFTPLSAVGASWTAGQEVVLMTIPVSGGSSQFEIVNDSWTVAHNGNFYVSLNGVDHTGSIYATGNGFPTVSGKGPALTVIPNPTDGAADIWLRLDKKGPADIQVLNTTGQVVWSHHYDQTAELHETVALKQYGAGTYMVKVKAGETVLNEQVVVH
jgi:hypothetical protein